MGATCMWCNSQLLTKNLQSSIECYGAKEAMKLNFEHGCLTRWHFFKQQGIAILMVRTLGDVRNAAEYHRCQSRIPYLNRQNGST